MSLMQLSLKLLWAKWGAAFSNDGITDVLAANHSVCCMHAVFNWLARHCQFSQNANTAPAVNSYVCQTDLINPNAWIVRITTEGCILAFITSSLLCSAFFLLNIWFILFFFFCCASRFWELLATSGMKQSSPKTNSVWTTIRFPHYSSYMSFLPPRFLSTCICLSKPRFECMIPL